MVSERAQGCILSILDEEELIELVAEKLAVKASLVGSVLSTMS